MNRRNFLASLAVGLGLAKYLPAKRIVNKPKEYTLSLSFTHQITEDDIYAITKDRYAFKRAMHAHHYGMSPKRFNEILNNANT